MPRAAAVDPRGLLVRLRFGGCAPAAAVVVRGRVGPGGGGRSGIHSLALPPCPRPAARAPGAGATGVGRDRPRRCAAFPPPEWLGGGDGVRLRTARAVVRAGSGVSCCRALRSTATPCRGRRRSGSRGTDPAGRVAGGGGCRTARDRRRHAGVGEGCRGVSPGIPCCSGGDGASDPIDAFNWSVASTENDKLSR